MTDLYSGFRVNPRDTYFVLAAIVENGSIIGGGVFASTNDRNEAEKIAEQYRRDSRFRNVLVRTWQDMNEE